jgi:hypothetical protein
MTIPKKIPPPGRILQIMPAAGWRAFCIAWIDGDPEPIFEEVPVVGWALIEDPEPRSYDPPVEVILLIHDSEYDVLPIDDELLTDVINSVHRKLSPLDDLETKKKEWTDDLRTKMKYEAEKKAKAKAAQGGNR